MADDRVSDAIRRRERRLRDERPVTVERPFSEADLSALEAEIGRPGRDAWPQPGGDSFHALSDREWEPVDDDRIGPVFVGTVALLTGALLVLTGIAFARLVMVFL